MARIKVGVPPIMFSPGFRFVGIVAVVVLSACAVGPDYRRPDTPVDAHFANASESAFREQNPVANFWTLFNDAALDQLVADALAHNNDLRVALANLQAARATQRLVGFDQYPTVDATGGYERALESQNQLPGYTRRQREGNTAEAGFDAFWELDFFGRVRRNVEAAGADEETNLAQLQSVQVSVTAEIARDYFVLRGLQDQLDVAQRNADNQRQTLKITQIRLDAGRGNELDSSRADAQMQTTLASIPPLESSIATTIYRLSVLTGRQPQALVASLAPIQEAPALPVLNDIGAPEALLRRRPDVRAAERQLAAATARIGVATGDLFPKVTFNGSFGYNAETFAGFGTIGGETYSFGPSITWAAFDLGRVKARIAGARANADAALAAYEQSVLIALEETEGALVSYGRAQSRRDTLVLAAAASDKAASLARQRFEGGLSDFLDVLQAEAAALIAEESVAQSRTDAATSLVAVYKALGGGWSDSLGNPPGRDTPNGSQVPSVLAPSASDGLKPP